MSPDGRSNRILKLVVLEPQGQFGRNLLPLLPHVDLFVVAFLALAIGHGKSGSGGPYYHQGGEGPLNLSATRPYLILVK